MLAPPLPAGLESENGDAVEPAALPNRPPEAGAEVVFDCPDAALEAGVPNVKDIFDDWFPPAEPSERT